jgi:PHD/YefM family antitoxin component YafN of YafNO toxin-antitoxin module
MTATLATSVATDEEPWQPEHMHSEPLDEAARHLPELAARLDAATRGRILLTRDGRPDLVLMTADELVILEETLFWATHDLRRVAAGEPLEDEEPEEAGLDEAGAKELLETLRRRAAGAQD